MMFEITNRKSKGGRTMSNNTIRLATVGLLLALSGTAMAFFGPTSFSNVFGDVASNLVDVRTITLPNAPGSQLVAARQRALDRQFCGLKSRLDADYACQRASLETCVKSPTQLQSCLDALANAYHCQSARLLEKYCRVNQLLATSEQTGRF
jgi:hypothetical protein